MYTRRSKNQRPSPKTALRAQENGITGWSSYESNREREDSLDDSINFLTQNLPSQFPRTNKLDYAVIKAHLIFESILTEYICAKSAVCVQREDLRISYPRRLDVAFLMGFGVNDTYTIPTFDLMNEARNQSAHRFDLDKSVVDKILRINTNDPHTFKIHGDADRIKDLRSLTRGFCHVTAGFLHGQYWAEKIFESKKR